MCGCLVNLGFAGGVRGMGYICAVLCCAVCGWEMVAWMSRWL